MHRPLIAANWKMYKTIGETEDFIHSFLPMVRDVKDVDILIAPPFTSLTIGRKEWIKSSVSPMVLYIFQFAAISGLCMKINLEEQQA